MTAGDAFSDDATRLEEALTAGHIAAVDAAIARASGRVAKRRAALARGEMMEADPIGVARSLAGKKAFDRLTELLAHDARAREGARRHVAALCLARLMHDGETELARASTKPQELLALERKTGTFATSISSLVAERDERTRRAHLDLLSRAATEVAAEARELAVIRREACVRLHVPDPIAFAAEVPAASLREGANALLASTDMLFADVVARATKKKDLAAFTIFDAIDIARIDDATEGWPARISREWLKDAVPALAAHTFELAQKTRVVGASSFLRALYQFGAELRVHRAPRSLPFIVAQDPWPRAAHRTGFLLSALGASPEFHRRALGLSPGPAKDQALMVAAGAVVFVRWLAVRLLLALDDAGPSEFEELTLRAFGAPAPSELRGAWPVFRMDEGARFVALIESRAWSLQMVDRFDDDWFRNPRAGRDIASRLAAPMRDVDPPEDIAARAKALGASLEQAFG